MLIGILCLAPFIILFIILILLLIAGMIRVTYDVLFKEDVQKWRRRRQRKKRKNW